MAKFDTEMKGEAYEVPPKSRTLSSVCFGLLVKLMLFGLLVVMLILGFDLLLFYDMV